MSSTPLHANTASTPTPIPDPIAAMLARVSAARLVEPGPNREQLELILKCAARAPDHGRLRPWRFVVVEGAARERFGDMMAETVRRANPAATEIDLQRERDKAMRAPLIVVAAAQIAVEGKIPAVEQALAVGAAVQNMIMASQALGFGSMWKTGAQAYDDGFKAALGFEPSAQLIGFVYLGTSAASPGPREAVLDGVVSWL